MAVPKKKVSASRRGNRRGGNGTYKLDIPNVIVDKDTGKYKLPHHISLDGMYNGRKVIEEKVKEEKTEESAQA